MRSKPERLTLPETQSLVPLEYRFEYRSICIFPAISKLIRKIYRQNGDCLLSQTQATVEFTKSYCFCKETSFLRTDELKCK